MHNNAASKLKMFSRNFNEERVMSFTLAMSIQFTWKLAVLSPHTKDADN